MFVPLSHHMSRLNHFSPRRQPKHDQPVSPGNSWMHNNAVVMATASLSSRHELIFIYFIIKQAVIVLSVLEEQVAHTSWFNESLVKSDSLSCCLYYPTMYSPSFTYFYSPLFAHFPPSNFSFGNKPIKIMTWAFISTSLKLFNLSLN